MLRGHRVLRRLGLRAALILDGDIIEDSSPSFPLSVLSLAADAAGVSLPLLVSTPDGGVVGRAPGSTFSIAVTNRGKVFDDSPLSIGRLLAAKVFPTIRIVYIYIYRL